MLVVARNAEHGWASANELRRCSSIDARMFSHVGEEIPSASSLSWHASDTSSGDPTASEVITGSVPLFSSMHCCRGVFSSARANATDEEDAGEIVVVEEVEFVITVGSVLDDSVVDMRAVSETVVDSVVVVAVVVEVEVVGSKVDSTEPPHSPSTVKMSCGVLKPYTTMTVSSTIPEKELQSMSA